MYMRSKNTILPLLFCFFSLLALGYLFSRIHHPPLQTLSIFIDKEALSTKLSMLPAKQLQAMQKAGEEFLYWQRILEKSKATLVSDILKGQESLLNRRHYPKGEVADAETHSQYYYHRHRGEEHGHFHLFLESPAIPPNCIPPSRKKEKEPPFVHLLALSMDNEGLPIKLFTTNQWVSGGIWIKAEDLCPIVERFKVDHAFPSWPANQCLNALLRLFSPQISELLHARDAAIEKWMEKNPKDNVFENRKLEIPSEISICVHTQIETIREILEQINSEKMTMF